MIMPPLVGVMGFTFILGRAGTVNIILQDYLGFQQPVNFMYGIHGVLLVETLAPVSADDVEHRGRDVKDIALAR